MCRVTAAVIFIVNVNFSLIVGANHVQQEESPRATSDEMTLLQAAANSKAGSNSETAVDDNAIPDKRDVVCEDVETPLDVSTVVDPEPLQAPLIHGSVAPTPVDPAPSLIDQMRVLLLIISLVIAANAAKHWRRQKDVAVVAPPRAKRQGAVVASQRGELHKAALQGDYARCKLLLGVGPPEALFAADAWGSTPLHASAKTGAKAVAQLLLKHGAPVDPVDAWDETPLHLAAREGHTEICQVLAQRGASLHAMNAQDWTPLVAAAHAGQEVVCRELLALGAGVAGLPEEELPNLLSELMAETILRSAA